VISRDVCGCFNKRVSVHIGCSCVLWFLSSLVRSVLLIMFPEYKKSDSQLLALLSFVFRDKIQKLIHTY